MATASVWALAVVTGACSKKDPVSSGTDGGAGASSGQQAAAVSADAQAFEKSLEGSTWISGCTTVKFEGRDVVEKNKYEFRPEGKLLINKFQYINQAACEDNNSHASGVGEGTFSVSSTRVVEAREEEPHAVSLNVAKVELQISGNRAVDMFPTQDQIELATRAQDEGVMYVMSGETADRDEDNRVFITRLKKIFKK